MHAGRGEGSREAGVVSLRPQRGGVGLGSRPRRGRAGPRRGGRRARTRVRAEPRRVQRPLAGGRQRGACPRRRDRRAAPRGCGVPRRPRRREEGARRGAREERRARSRLPGRGGRPRDDGSCGQLPRSRPPRLSPSRSARDSEGGAGDFLESTIRVLSSPSDPTDSRRRASSTRLDRTRTSRSGSRRTRRHARSPTSRRDPRVTLQFFEASRPAYVTLSGPRGS